jgi:hypothetical protein
MKVVEADLVIQPSSKLLLENKHLAWTQKTPPISRGGKEGIVCEKTQNHEKPSWKTLYEKYPALQAVGVTDVSMAAAGGMKEHADDMP